MWPELYSSNISGMLSSLGQGWQYWQPVQETTHSWLKVSRALATRASSCAFRLPTPDFEAEARFSSTWGMRVMPLKTSETSGWFHSHCKAQSAGERLTGDWSQTACTSAG